MEGALRIFGYFFSLHSKSVQYKPNESCSLEQSSIGNYLKSNPFLSMQIKGQKHSFTYVRALYWNWNIHTRNLKRHHILGVVTWTMVLAVDWGVWTGDSGWSISWIIWGNLTSLDPNEALILYLYCVVLMCWSTHTPTNTAIINAHDASEKNTIFLIIKRCQIPPRM